MRFQKKVATTLIFASGMMLTGGLAAWADPQELLNEAQSFVQDAADNFQPLVDLVTGEVNEATEEYVTFAEQVAGAAQSAVEETKNDGAAMAGLVVDESFSAAQHTVSDGSAQAQQAISSGSAQAQQAIGNGAQAAKDAIDMGSQAAQQGISDGSEQLQQGISDGSQQLQEALHGAHTTVQNALNGDVPDLGGTVEEVAGTATGAIDGLFPIDHSGDVRLLLDVSTSGVSVKAGHGDTEVEVSRGL